MTSELEPKTVVKRVAKTSGTDDKLSEKDWTGVVSVIILIGYFGLLSLKYLMNKEITELDGIGAFVGLIIGWYLRGKV